MTGYANEMPATVLKAIEQMAARLEAAGLSFSDGFGQGTTNAFAD